MDYNTHHFVLMHGAFITQLQKNEHTSRITPCYVFPFKIIKEDENWHKEKW
jgi:hypothetical protein